MMQSLQSLPMHQLSTFKFGPVLAPCLTQTAQKQWKLDVHANKFWGEKIIESAEIWTWVCIAKWPSGCREFQHPEGIQPMSTHTLQQPTSIFKSQDHMNLLKIWTREKNVTWVTIKWLKSIKTSTDCLLDFILGLLQSNIEVRQTHQNSWRETFDQLILQHWT